MNMKKNILKYTLVISISISLLACNKQESSIYISTDEEEWEKGETTEILPEYGGKIRIDSSTELPDGSSVNMDKDVLTLTHRPSIFTLKLDCANELEIIGADSYGIDIKEDQSAGNTFIIKTGLVPVGAMESRTTLRFKRKNLTKAYPEDTVSVVLSRNPSEYEGIMNFDSPTYMYDFGTYADGEFGKITVAEDQGIKMLFDNDEAPWVMLAEEENASGSFRILGGWRPNDPEADGRVQDAYMVIYDRETGNEEERYTIRRRNYGMPVTYMNGVWWCKYNARGNSCDFNDQILVKDDPAAKAGMSLLEYLNNCTCDEYMELWTWAYQSDNAGKEIKGEDGKITVSGYSAKGQNLNLADPKSIAPPGYEVPAFEHYNRIFMEWWMYIDRDNGPHRPHTPWSENPQVYVKSGKRSDLVLDGVGLPVTYHFEVYNTKNGKKDQQVTFYGPGSQWNGNGINHNKILFTCHSSQGKGWFNRFDSYGLQVNGGSGADTRILRLVKTPVEYIY